VSADIADSRTTASNVKGPGLGIGGVTLAAMVMAGLALDDITTDNATRFPVEYTILVVCAAWLLLVAWQLFRSGSRVNAGITVISLAAATVMAAGGIGHKRDGGWAVFWPQYLPLTWAWVHGVVVGILLIRRGVRVPAKADTLK
jgi:ammonia channel protein AmtB